MRKEIALAITAGCALVCLGAMLYAHRRVIKSMITGEPLGEPSEAAKKWCPPVVAAEAAK